jgi:homoserine kinase
MRFTVRAPASSANLGPGFDALGVALDLWNEIVVDTEGSPGELVLDGRDAHLLDGRRNLALEAMGHLAQAAGRELPPFALTARTAVPVSRGLGSSAAAIVAGLLAADRLLGLSLSRTEFYAHAWQMEGHGDNVGAALYGGAILAVPGVSEAILLRSGSGVAELGLTTVVYVPEMTGATWAARAALPERIPHADAAFNVATASGLTVGLLLGDRELIAAGMHDRLHEPYRARLFPHLAPLTEAARAAGAVGACLSGAGPSILALCDREHVSAITAALAAAAVHLGVHGETVELPLSALGAHLVEADGGRTESRRRLGEVVASARRAPLG